MEKVEYGSAGGDVAQSPNQDTTAPVVPLLSRLDELSLELAVLDGTLKGETFISSKKDMMVHENCAYAWCCKHWENTYVEM